MTQKAHIGLPAETVLLAAQAHAADRAAKFLAGGCLLLKVLRGWEAQAVRFSPHTVVCLSEVELTDGLNGPSRMVFVPLESALSDQDIERICAKLHASKSVYKEVQSL